MPAGWHSPHRLAIVGPTFPTRGGIARFTTELVHHLRRRLEVELYSFRRLYPGWLFRGSGDPDPSVAPRRERARRTLDGLNPVSWWRTAAELVAARPDVLVLQWWTSYWLPLHLVLAGAARRAGIPVVTVVHQLREPGTPSFELPSVSCALRRSDGVVALPGVSSADLGRLAAADVVRRAAMPPLAWPRRCGPTRREARIALGLGGDAPVLLFFGFVRPYKGLLNLLRALDLVPAARLVVAGQVWGRWAPYDDEIRRLGLADRVLVIDRYVGDEEIELLFAAADALAMPYLNGGHSAVAAIGRAFGLPLIASDLGGLAAAVTAGGRGRCVPPADVGALAHAIREVLAEPSASAGGAARLDPAADWSSLAGLVEEMAGVLRASGGSREADSGR